jgi:hypothetical protein
MAAFFRRYMALTMKEIQQLRRNRVLLIQLMLPPTVVLIIFGYALNPKVRDLRTGIVDQSMTTESQGFIDSLTQNVNFDVTHRFLRLQDAEDALKSLDLDLFIVIPPDFARTLGRGQTASVQVVIDAVDANTAQIAQGYLRSTLDDYNYSGGGGGGVPAPKFREGRSLVRAAHPRTAARCAGRTTRLPLQSRSRHFVALRHWCDEHYHVHQRVPRCVRVGSQRKGKRYYRAVADDSGTDRRNVTRQDFAGFCADDGGSVRRTRSRDAGLRAAGTWCIVVIYTRRGLRRLGWDRNWRHGGDGFEIATAGAVADLLCKSSDNSAFWRDFSVGQHAGVLPEAFLSESPPVHGDHRSWRHIEGCAVECFVAESARFGGVRHFVVLDQCVALSKGVANEVKTFHE